MIDQTSKLSKRFSQKEFDERGLGITIDQWVLLKIIESNEGVSQRELANISVRDAASITRTLDLLSKKQLINREPIPDNRRQFKIVLTAAGRSFIEKNMEMVQRHRAHSTKGFTEEEIEQLRSMLKRMQKNLE